LPIIQHSLYKPPFFIKNGHIQTIYASYFRKTDEVVYNRERISTPDNDFLDLDWSTVGSKKLVIISHGLEGDTNRSYIKGMVKAFNSSGWDGLAWNFRSCSGETNQTKGFYHSGSYEDLETVIKHVASNYHYERIDLTGFSMGGNITLMYLGKRGNKVHPAVNKAAVFSVPCDLKNSSEQLAKLSCKLYMKRFLRKLKRKLEAKKRLFPDLLDQTDFHLIKNFKQYDDCYTAPLHGFKDAEGYWEQCSSGKFLNKITIPTLIVNALNDPFLGENCYPREQASQSKFVFLEIPKTGGHVGFPLFNHKNQYWSEQRAVEFLS